MDVKKSIQSLSLEYIFFSSPSHTSYYCTQKYVRNFWHSNSTTVFTMVRVYSKTTATTEIELVYVIMRLREMCNWY